MTELILDIEKQKDDPLIIPTIGRVGDIKSNSVDVYVKKKRKPYSLAGIQIFYECLKPDFKTVRDSTGVKIIDEENGHFQYTFPPEVFSVAGTIRQSFFALEKGEEFRATTQDFSVVSLRDVLNGNVESEQYISDLDKLIEQTNGIIEHIKVLEGQAINLVDEEVIAIRERVDTILKEIKDVADKEIQGIQNEVTNIQEKLIGIIIDAQKKFSDLDEKVDELQNTLDTMDVVKKEEVEKFTDPMSYLNSVKILTRIPTKQSIDGRELRLQGVNMNDDEGEIYAIYQDETLARIEIFNLNGNSKSAKSFKIAPNTYMESLPYFHNAARDLLFIVRTAPDSNYSIFHYSLGRVLPGGQNLKGSQSVAVRDGDYMLTIDENASNGAIEGMYIYTWDSILDRNPVLVAEKPLETTINKPEKTQGVVQNKGYTFLCQGVGHPYLTVLNSVGQIVNVFRYSKRSIAEIINKAYPNTITNLKGWECASAGGCTYKGKLVTTQVAPDWAYLFVHNSVDGTPIEVELDGTIVVKKGL